MKKKYISPFTNIIESITAEKILTGSNSKTQGFGNDQGNPTNPDVSGTITEEEGDITNLSKRRSGFYNEY